MKTCKQCDKEKESSDFYKLKGNSDGLTGKCKECIKEGVRLNRQAKAGYYKEYDKKRYQEDPKVKARHKRYQATDAGKASMQKSRLKWLESNRIKRRAHMDVGNAIKRGDLIKPDLCECCGAKDARLEGHHADYSKPLIVAWLCRKCHVEEHNALAETEQS